MDWLKKIPGKDNEWVKTSPVEKPICHGKTPIHVDRFHEEWKAHRHDCKEKGCGASFTPWQKERYEKHHGDS